MGNLHSWLDTAEESASISARPSSAYPQTDRHFLKMIQFRTGKAGKKLALKFHLLA